MCAFDLDNGGALADFDFPQIYLWIAVLELVVLGLTLSATLSLRNFSLLNARMRAKNLSKVTKQCLTDTAIYSAFSFCVHLAEFAWTFTHQDDHMFAGLMLPLHGLVVFVIGPRVIANLRATVTVNKSAVSASGAFLPSRYETSNASNRSRPLANSDRRGLQIRETFSPSPIQHPSRSEIQKSEMLSTTSLDSLMKHSVRPTMSENDDHILHLSPHSTRRDRLRKLRSAACLSDSIPQVVSQSNHYANFGHRRYNTTGQELRTRLEGSIPTANASHGSVSATYISLRSGPDARFRGTLTPEVVKEVDDLTQGSSWTKIGSAYPHPYRFAFVGMKDHPFRTRNNPTPL